MDTAKRIEETLTRAIHKIRQENLTFQVRHGEALQQLGMFFGTTAENIKPTPKTTNQTSSTPTAPNYIRIAPCTHQHITRENTPDIIPT